MSDDICENLLPVRPSFWGLPGQSRCVALDRVLDDARDAAGVRAFDRLPRPSLSAPEKTYIAKGTKTAEAF